VIKDRNNALHRRVPIVLISIRLPLDILKNVVIIYYISALIKHTMMQFHKHPPVY